MRVTLLGEGQAELEEKRSVFIGYAVPVSNEEEALAVVARRKEKYSDATHNVWAYYLNGGAHARCSDDGEPQGTAGAPLLNVLKMSGATDMCVVVTRYFGGTLLGAGGLIRAYTASAKSALDAAGFAEMRDYNLYRITVGYSDYQRLTVQLKSLGAQEDGADFGAEVSVQAAIEASRSSELEQLVRELTGGKGICTPLGCAERPHLI